MIESKTYYTMRCDKCGCMLTDNSGHTVQVIDYYSDDLYEMAKEKGWICRPNPYGCLCPDCKGKKGAR